MLVLMTVVVAVADPLGLLEIREVQKWLNPKQNKQRYEWGKPLSEDAGLF